MTRDELAEHLDALKRDDCYRVDSVMKESTHEKTQKVYFVGANGAEQGPFVRKYIAADAGFGEAYERVLRAQKNGKRFAHLPAIIDYYSVGSDRVVIMEYVRGETLQDVVYRCDPSVALAGDLFPRICDAVIELHESFDPVIIHRDLKPSNIIVSRDSLTIIDLGIARTFKDGSEVDTKNFGTKAYAPPEQFGFGQTDERSDVYALGMLLYFCLTEKMPEPKARAKEFSSPLIPHSMRVVIMKATELNPTDRYANALELKSAFETAVAQSVVTPPVAVAQSPIATTPAAGPHFTQTSQQKRTFLSRIPTGVGIAWDMAVLLVVLLFCWVGMSQAFEPIPGSLSAEESLPIRIIKNAALCLFIILPCGYFISDRRPLRHFIPVLKKLTVLKDIALLLIGFGLTVLIFALAGFLP